MKQEIEVSIIKDIQFQRMVRSRNHFALWLSVSVLVIYFIFIGIACFYPQILAQTFENQDITVGMPVAALVIIISWLITGVYIYVTNQHFDKVKAQLKEAYHYE